MGCSRTISSELNHSLLEGDREAAATLQTHRLQESYRIHKAPPQGYSSSKLLLGQVRHSGGSGPKLGREFQYGENFSMMPLPLRHPNSCKQPP